MPETGIRRPLIVPIFIPHQGCPHRCVFCQQERITSQTSKALSPIYLKGIIERALQSPAFDLRRPREIAFFGGTFTGLPKEKIREYLTAVRPYLDRGLFESIRVSTRPDALDPEILEIMARLGVLTVELGVQSMDDGVLRQSKRGHSAEDTVRAVGILRDRGFRIGMQLMPGLPGDSRERFLRTVQAVIDLGADMVRIYPAVVIRGTEMAEMYLSGRYRPLGLEDAVRLCEEGCVRLENRGIPVIRIGLMSSPSLLEEGQILAGPWHSAFGFLVRSGILLRRIRPFLPGRGAARRIRLRVPAREIPLVRGHRNQGLRMIEDLTGAEVVEVRGEDGFAPGHFDVVILDGNRREEAVSRGDEG